jgi:hypothetical protein
MRVHARVLLASAVAVALGVWALSAVGPGKAADDDKEAREAIEKLAETVAKGDKDAAKKQAEEVAKKVELSVAMELFKLRAKNGRGVGKNPGAITPDGIEAQIMGLAKKEPTKAALAKNGADLEEMANITTAISLIAEVHAPKKKVGDKDPKDWKQWVQDMQAASGDLTKAVKASDGPAIKTAATKLNSACNNCHGVFRD